MKTHQFFLSILAIVFVFAACSNDVQNNATNEETQETEQAETVQKYKLTPFEPSYDFPDAKLESMSYKDGKFTFTVTGESYKLGAQTPDAPQKMCANSAKGQHIHLIIDNQPYVAKYTNEFEYDVPDGEHYILAFISRSYHESIKHNGASIAKKVT
ncbi:MAG: phosphopeptide-binding protein, partial [Bacteroidetes bacterium]